MAGTSVTVIGDLRLHLSSCGPSSELGFPDTARAAVTTSIFQAEGGRKRRKTRGIHPPAKSAPFKDTTLPFTSYWPEFSHMQLLRDWEV